MCGITGWFSDRTARPEDIPALTRMAMAIAHRGPDGEGYRCLGNAAFAHRRLSIIDVDRGAQPMQSSNGRCVLTFNGEIYNYQDLRAELLRNGAVFHTDSDTEVILELYLKQGIEGFSRLRGMYAFALWDHQQEKGYLVRDPLGIKPLFYRKSTANTLEFGSEAKAILARTGSAARLSEQSLHLLLNFRYIPDQSSLCADIFQLLPGEVIEWSAKGSYSRGKLAEAQNEVGIESQVEPGADQNRPLIDVLRESVAKHLVSDVEVGAYLSGGIDSAAIVALALSETSRPVRTFTVNVGDDPMEASNAAKSAELLGVDNNLSNIEQQASSRLRDMIWHLEVPKVNALQVNTLARHAAGHVKVVLSGLGGDELFLGYNAHRWMSWCSGLQKWPKHGVSLLGAASHGILSHFMPVYWSEFERANLIAKHIGSAPRVYGLFRNLWDSEKGRRKIYGPRMLDQQLPDAFDWLEEHWPKNNDPLMAMREFEWQRKMVNDLLWQEDRCSMAEGLEVRVPFVDRELREAVWPLQASQLMANGELKGLLKQTIKPIVPSEILNRKKSGFQVDSPTFFRRELQVLADCYLSPAKVKEHGLFNPNFIQNVRKLGEKKRYRWHYFMLYLMIGTHMWLELFEGGNRVPSQ